ncbi:MAG: hypothetical protein ABSD31_03340 [Candidatus Binataceae bacterium]|jgi:hypothetical protein
MSSPLAGKLFDESGEGLTPSHAVRGKRRYRYYVARSLITGTANQTETGWRISAAEIERSVATAARVILDDRCGPQKYHDVHAARAVIAYSWCSPFRIA